MEYKQYISIHDNSSIGTGTGGKDGERGKKLKLKAWLQEKNDREGTTLAYGTVYKWFQRFGNFEQTDETISSLKKVRTRPFHGEFYVQHACMYKYVY